MSRDILKFFYKSDGFFYFAAIFSVICEFFVYLYDWYTCKRFLCVLLCIFDRTDAGYCVVHRENF